MSDENLTLHRVKTLIVAARKEYVKKHRLLVTGSKKVLATSEILVIHAVVNALFTKKYKMLQQTLNRNSKQAFVYPLDPSANLTQINYDLAYTYILHIPSYAVKCNIIITCPIQNILLTKWNSTGSRSYTSASCDLDI